MDKVERWLGLALKAALLAAMLVAGAALVVPPVARAANVPIDLARYLPGAVLSADTLTLKRSAPIAQVPTRLTTTSASAAAWTEFPATDIAVGYQRDDVGQMLVVINLDTAARICLDFADRDTDGDGDVETTDCSTACAALTTTCHATGASTDADIVLPGTSRTFYPAGRMCSCFLSNTANGDVQLAMVPR